jgi:tRNA-dihydrouridine synthase
MPPFNLEHPFALAPMCDFVRLGGYAAKVGAPDLFHIEYARVHEHTAWSQDWLDFICEHGHEHRVIAQLIGREPGYFTNGVEFLKRLPIAGIDLNLGCPAPKIYKQNVGGGLLRELALVDKIVGALREAIEPPLMFSVKFRLGFGATDAWEKVLEILRKHGVDWGTIHLRTVEDGYWAPARFDLARQIIAAAPCPMLLNGDIQTVSQARELIKTSGAWGVSIGRGAIRYPWIFARAKGGAAPKYRDAYEYLRWIIETSPSIGPMKGYLNFLGLSVDENGRFLKKMRQSRTPEELLKLGDEWLLPRKDEIFPEAPFAKLYARPSMEKPKE